MHRPFQGLRPIAVKPAATPPRSRSAVSRKVGARQTAPAVVAPSDNSTAFLDAVADVTPLDSSTRQRVARPAPATPAREITHPDAEALAELSDLVSGHVPFDISDSDEYIEGAVIGLDPRLLRRLRAGEFAYHAHLDLHGMNSEQARTAVDEFLSQAYRSGKRCVLIVHGRGRNSKDQTPVLKGRLTGWLARGQAARRILAFTSARPCDGGAGALYVLLRRDRHPRRPIKVTAGAKS